MELEIGKNPNHWNSSLLFKLFKAWLKDFQVASKLINNKPFDIFPYIFRQKCNCSIKACKNASSLYIANQYYWSLRKPRSADIYNISFIQINFGSSPCSFHNNDVIFYRKP